MVRDAAIVRIAHRHGRGQADSWDTRYEAQEEAAMRADQVEASWDAGKGEWLVRIVSGEEVIRRHFKLPRDADEQAVGAAAQKTVQDEGYEADVTLVSVRR
jgi:hypothetical protein